jgi:hypothetical protein
MLRSSRSTRYRRLAPAPSAAPMPMDPNRHDEMLAERFPDLRMHCQDPSPARHAHDRLATDTKNYYSKGGLAHELIGAMVPGGDHALFSQSLRDIGVELDRYYNLSPTMRRLFNFWLRNLRNGQRLMLRGDSNNVPLAGETDLAALEAGILLVPPQHAFEETGETYPSDKGPTLLCWSQRLLRVMLRVITGQPLGDGNGHVRGAAIEYANIVGKENDPVSCRRYLATHRRPSCHRWPGRRLPERLSFPTRLLHWQDWISTWR